jgi:hypothetical protein
MTALRGSCLCGGVRFEIAGPLMRSSHCHCRQCQKGHGAPFRTRARVAAADFRFLAGEELVSFYESTPGTHRGFCKVCGAPVLVKFEEHSRSAQTRQRTEHPIKSTKLNSREVGNARNGRDDDRCDYG